MPVGDFVAGLGVWGLTWGAAVAVGELLRRRRLSYLTGARAVLAVALLATAALMLAHLLPGAVGALSRWTALAVALALVAAAAVVPAAGERPATPPPAPPTAGALSHALAALAAGLLGCAVLLKAWNSSVTPAEDVDSLTFHLPNVARWMQSGSFWQIDQFNPLLANGNYPQNGDLIYLSVLQAWENDAFVRLVSVPFVALAALAVYALARELRAPRPTAVLAGTVLASLPVVSLAAYEGAKTDSIFLASFAIGVLFLVRHFDSGYASDLVLGGVGLGIAFGTKWYGVYSVVLVAAVWLGATVLARGRGPRLVRDGALLTATVTLFGGFWLLRNLVESGNPVFPVEVRVAGATLFDAPRDFIRECSGYRIVDYLTAPDVWAGYILPAYGDNYALPGVLLGLAVVAAAAIGGVALARRRRGAAPELPAVVALAVAALLIAGAYSVTPYTAFGTEGEPILVGANTRWLGGALVFAAPLAAWGAARLGRFQVIAEIVAVVAVTDGVRRALHPPIVSLLAVVLLVAAAAAAAYAVCVLSARLRRPTVMRVAAAAVAAVLLAGVAHARQRAFNDGRYEGDNAVLTWIAQNAQSGQRIGLAGVWGVGETTPVWPAFGERIGNRVEFVGPFVDEQLREYDSRAEWAQTIRRGDYDLLIVGRGGYSDRCPVPGQETDDDAWARAEGFDIVARTPRLTLYRISSPSA